MTDKSDAHTGSTDKDSAAKSNAAAVRGHSYGGLAGLATSQRLLASVDLTKLAATTRAFSRVSSEQLRLLAEAHAAISKGIAQSIDFSNIGSAFQTCADALGFDSAREAQRRWADSLSKAIDVSALGRAVDSSSLLLASSGASQELAEAFKHRFDGIGRIAESMTFKLPDVDFGRWAEKLNDWIPRNLQGYGELEVVADIALSEGIPLSWVPRIEVIEALLAADLPETRLKILIEHRDDILDDCDAALARANGEIALQCRGAIDALRRGLHGPAQSHASNILDSIICASFGSSARDQAIQLSQDDFMDQPLGVAAENLTLRPVFRAYSTWWPNSGTPVPDHFSRHVTCHGIGHVGVIVPTSALIAVMLATSLAVQYMPAGIGADKSASVAA